MKDSVKQTKDFKSNNDNISLAILHLSGILPLFFPYFIFWNKKKNEVKEMSDHLRAVIAFQSTILFMLMLGFCALYKADNPNAILAFLFLSALFSIKNAMKVLNGYPYHYFGLFKDKN